MNAKLSNDEVLHSRKMKKRQINRENILRFAEKEFLEKGYENARVEDIAFNSGNAKATIYNYFESKEDILTAIIAKAYLLYSKTLLDDLKNHESNSIFRVILDSYLYFDEHYPYYTELIFSIEAVLIIKKIYDKDVQNKSLTQSEEEYRDAEAETVNLYVDVFTKFVTNTITDRKAITKMIQAFAQFGATIRETIMRGKLIQRSNQETVELLETMIKILEIGIKNYQ